MISRAPAEHRKCKLVYRLSERVLDLGTIGEECRLLLESGIRERIDYYDTFDFRLFSAGLALEKHDAQLRLREVDGEQILYEAPAPERLEGLLPWDLPPPLQLLLDKPLALRALGLVGTATILRRRGRIEDDNLKTIARVELEEVLSDGRQDGGARFLLVFPLRGYDREVRRLFTKAGAGVDRETPGSIVAEAARWQGRAPGSYRSRPLVPLSSEAPAGRAVSDLLSAHLSVMRENEAGIVEDRDTEFLHDYRVALRRMRSLLSEFRRVVDPESMAELSGLLKVVSSATGPLRDLDVLLLSQEGYLRRVPESLRGGMETYFSRVSEERGHRYQELRIYLRSEEYERRILRIRRLIEELGAASGGPSLRKAGNRSLAKRLRRVKRDLVSLSTAHVSEIARHQVRIECKKLRYLLEALAPVYPRKAVNRAIAELKRFQDALGRLQDVAVQQESLLAIVHGDETTHPRVAAAIGALVSSLSEESAASMDSIGTEVATYRRRLTATQDLLLPEKEIHR